MQTDTRECAGLHKPRPKPPMPKDVPVAMNTQGQNSGQIPRVTVSLKCLAPRQALACFRVPAVSLCGLRPHGFQLQQVLGTGVAQGPPAMSVEDQRNLRPLCGTLCCSRVYPVFMCWGRAQSHKAAAPGLFIHRATVTELLFKFIDSPASKSKGHHTSLRS